MGNKQTSFTSVRLENVLKRSLIRLELVMNKKVSLQKGLRDEVISLHHSGKTDLADIKAESLIVNENTVAVVEELKRIVPNLISNRNRIEKTRPCVEDLKQDICTLIYCSGRVMAEELSEAKDLFIDKYGSGFCNKAQNNEGGVVDQRIVERLRFDNISEVSKKLKVEEIMAGC